MLSDLGVTSVFSADARKTADPLPMPGEAKAEEAEPKKERSSGSA